MTKKIRRGKRPEKEEEGEEEPQVPEELKPEQPIQQESDKVRVG